MKESFEKWIKRILMLIASFVIGFGIFVALLFSIYSIVTNISGNKNANILSDVVGMLSIVLGVSSLIQSYKYNQESAVINEKTKKSLDKILSKQSDVLDALVDVKLGLDFTSDLNETEKTAIIKTLNKDTDYFAKISSTPFNEIPREVIQVFIPFVFRRFYERCDMSVTRVHKENAAFSITDQQHAIYTSYVVRSTVLGKDWPKADESFGEHVSKFFKEIGSEFMEKDRYLAIVIFADTVYYRIYKRPDKYISGKIDTSNESIFRNTSWLTQINSSLTEF